MSRRKGKKANQLNDRLPSESLIVITFDQFFLSLLRNNLVHSHHKTPLNEFFKAAGKLEASEEEFLDLFKSY